MQEQDAIRRYLSEIGRKGGQSKSPAKQAASRRNGARNFRRVEAEEKPAPVSTRPAQRIGEGLWAGQD